MSGKGELVEYTRLFGKAPLSTAERTALKAKIIADIDGATTDITIVVLLKASQTMLEEELEELKKRGGKKPGGKKK